MVSKRGGPEIPPFAEPLPIEEDFHYIPKGFTMSVNQRIATALVTLVGAILAIWNIELPSMVVEGLALLVGLVVGWVLPTPKQKGN